MNRHYFYLFLFCAIPTLYFLSLPISVGDLAVWIAHGNYLLATGKILRQDIYSVLSTNELIYPVGSSFFYALFYSFFGFSGPIILNRLAILVLPFLWYKAGLEKIYKKGNDPWTFQLLVVSLLAWSGASLLFVDRQALLAIVPFTVSFFILQKDDDLSRSDIVKLNLLNIVWVNIHGSWMILFLMYFWREGTRAVLLKKGIYKTQIFGVLSLLITSLVNPFGYKVFSYIFETANISKLRGLDEWGPTTFASTNYLSQVYLYYVLVLTVLVFYIYKFLKDRSSILSMITSPFTLMLILGFQSIRNTLWAFFILIPFVLHQGLLNSKHKTIDSVTPSKKIFNGLIVLTLILFAFLLFPQNKHLIADVLPKNKQATYDQSAPFAFSKILNEKPDQAPVFNDWEYGSFLILTQNHPVFIDTRNIIYRQNDFEEYNIVVNAAPGWPGILDKYKIKYVLLNKTLRLKLIAEINTSNQWNQLAEDDQTILFERE